jgi:ABC-type multidrug transport system fused ATPase/permease subunit
VSESLERLRVMQVVVAHRLSTIRNADRLYVLDACRLVESGTYSELIRQGGLFAELAKRQMAAEVHAAEDARDGRGFRQGPDGTRCRRG